MSHTVKLGIAIVIAAIVIVAIVTLPVGDWAIAVVSWIRDAGPAAVVLFVVAYVVATVLLLPGSALTLGAGFVYGPVWGTLIVSPASVLAATVAFALARRFGRGWFTRRAAAIKRAGAIDRAIATQGLKITLLLRLTPIVPFNLLNYLLGLTRVRLRDYVVGSAMGMLPGTVLFVYLGSLVTTTSELGAKPTSSAATAFYWIGLGFALITVVVVTRIARRALARELERSEPEPA